LTTPHIRFIGYINTIEGIQISYAQAFPLGDLTLLASTISLGEWQGLRE
jgi:hypothetical protein